MTTSGCRGTSMLVLTLATACGDPQSLPCEEPPQAGAEQVDVVEGDSITGLDAVALPDA